VKVEKMSKNKNKITCSIKTMDAFSLMRKMDDKSVDFICVDLPYGTTQNKWDIIIPFEQMWKEFRRVLKPNGVVALTSAQPFSALLVASNLEDFKYEMIWEKTVSSNQLNVKHQPLRSHESILVFYKAKPTYNEQRTKGEPYSIERKIAPAKQGYGEQKPSTKKNDGYRHARSVLKIPNPRFKGGHPTQKPVALMEHLIKMYSNPGDTVMDCCLGSGTTAVAASRLGRSFIGCDVDKKYTTMARKRIKNET
jgi:site-specific DNA-methyltransferase (adenine-specific)